MELEEVDVELECLMEEGEEEVECNARNSYLPTYRRQRRRQGLLLMTPGQKRGEGVEIRSRVGMAVRNRDGCSGQRCEGSQGEDNRMQIDNEGNGCSEMASDMRRRNMDSDKGNSILMKSVCVGGGKLALPGVYNIS